MRTTGKRTCAGFSRFARGSETHKPNELEIARVTQAARLSLRAPLVCAAYRVRTKSSTVHRAGPSG
ncbi:MAG: hypothetical protein V7640_231 [Betaproteobacteria bacterium]